MFERRTALTPEEAYQQLRNVLLKEKCKIVEDNPSESIVVEQGSWFGYSPKTVKKNIRFNFIAEESGTRIVSDTSWPSINAALAILSPIVAVIFTGFFWWLISDMKAEISGARSSIGGWFLELLGYTGYREALVLFNLLELLVFVLVAVVIIGIFSDVYCYAKRETVSEKVLSLLPQRILAPTSAPLRAQPLEKIYCAYCGAENPNNAVFCTKCGKRITKSVR